MKERIANASEMRMPMAAGSHIRLSNITSSTGAANTKPKIANAWVSGWAAAAPSFQEPSKITSVATTTATKDPSGTSTNRSSSRPRLSISIRHRHRAQREALARGELFGRALELAASGQDIAPARCAHRRGVAGIEDDFGKFLDSLPIRALVPGAGPRIERDEVDLRRDAREQLDQRLGVGKRIIDALEHDVFERDAPRVGNAGIVAAGVEQLRDRIFAVERNEFVAQLVAHGVQRYRQHAADFGTRARNIRHHARRRERDAALGDGDPVAIRRDQERVAHRLEIVERLAHAHHDDVGDEALALRRQAIPARARGSQPITEAIARDHDLPDDLAGREVAHEPLRAGMAERAGERAADLARDAKRAAVGLGNVDALDLVRPLA